MEVFNLREIKKTLLPSAVALGFFDGVHLGHQSVIHKAIQVSREMNISSLVFTMKDHPRAIFAPRFTPYLLTTFEEKLEILSQMGVEKLVWVDFDEEFARTSSENFIEEVLLKKLGAVAVVTGLDYRFGYRALGNVQTLARMGIEQGFKVYTMEPVFYKRKRISSTMIRELIKKGDLVLAAELLGRKYSITDKVIRGKGRGHILGIKTANLSPNQIKIIPAEGIYVARVEVMGATLPAVAHVGMQPTFRDSSFAIEVHLMEFEKNIYGEKITVQFVEKIRSIEKFKNANDLVRAIRNDISKAKAILNKDEI